MGALRRIATTLVLMGVAGILAAGTALAAPPVISGADRDEWNGTPVYEVSTGPEAARVEWRASSGARGVLFDGGRPTTRSLRIPLASAFEEGPATLTVIQRNRGPGPREETSIRTFVIDTTPPGPVVVTGPASVPEGGAFDVSWVGGEPGAVFIARVVAPGPGGDPTGDRVVQGPAETTATGARFAGLPAGAHTVTVAQRDRAGNVGTAGSLALTVLPPPAVSIAPAAAAPAAAAPPSPAPPAATTPAPVATPAPTARRAAMRLPSQSAGRLRPGRAATLRGVRPVLRWNRGPKGTRAYNVQIFRVPTVRAGAAPRFLKLRKVTSRFPRGNRLRTPRLARGACYVWRVWPYRAGGFTRRALGVSHFCVSRKPPARR